MNLPFDPTRSSPLFTVHWLCVVPPLSPEKLETDDDILAALVNAALDRGDRSFHRATGIWMWKNSGWRLQDTQFFIVDVDGAQTDRAVKWLLSRGYADEEDPFGYVYSFVFNDGKQHVLHSPKPLAKLTHVEFGPSHWVVAEKWAINLSLVVNFHILYGRLSVIHEHWAGKKS